MSDRNLDHDEAIDRDEYRSNPDESGKWVSALIALLGGWLIVEAVLFDIVLTQFWNDVLVGVLLLAIGAYNYSRRADEKTGSIAAATFAALLGLWLIAAPFVLGADAGTTETVNDFAFWNDIVAGVLALVLGAYSAYEAREDRRDTHRAVS